MMTTDDLLARAAIRRAVKGCRRCELWQVGCGPIPFSGSSPSKIVVVGEAPGRKEDEYQEPFRGPSGILLKATLQEVGVTASFVNVVSCFPDRTPTKDEVRACRTNLIAQLAILSPSYILVVGGVAVAALLNHGPRMGDVCGRWFRSYGLPTHYWCLATWHPAAVLRNNLLARAFLSDIAYFAKMTERDVEPSPGQFCVKCGDPTVDLLEDIPYCSRHKPHVGRT